MDIAEKIMAIETEIIDEVKEKNDSQIEKKKEELKERYDDFQKEIKNEQENILNEYKSRAEQKKEQIISRAILEKKNSRRKKLNDLINDFIDELHSKLNDFTDQKDYFLFIIDSIKEAAGELDDSEFIILLRNKDQNLKADLEEHLEKEMENYKFEIELMDKIKTGGFIIKAKNRQQLIENTFTALIDSFREEIAIELKNNILT
ncbi:vacuolar-type H+-ATPase subunit E/Vma4 [Halanaerobium saccharolyticum]|uniref:Vacuolar-type H+-ATPase subunit E/Vma4 n=1 Tax=Halanaerobium saccharolyticum TaxID=43595 RepID=A0A4R6LP48_9FIRM|nr:V-type ATP synthase subunit E family protein [Halanaerobium saccharolyticum]TDO87790.1 vacuolar-type H+-ATPase subunit E/Vma4 [Halanaerobium saccharolyticum]